MTEFPNHNPANKTEFANIGEQLRFLQDMIAQIAARYTDLITQRPDSEERLKQQFAKEVAPFQREIDSLNTPE